jgi:hypothetical protein
MKNKKFQSLVIVLAVIFSIANFNTSWARSKSIDEKIEDFIDDVSEFSKEAVQRFEDDLVAIQDYLNNYPWKGLIQDTATSGAVTLKHLKLNGHSKAVVVKPGECIEGTVQCDLDREQCSSFSLYRVVLGIKGQGAQTTVGNEFGIVAGESNERFTLVAPTEPGIYQIRFRLTESFFEGSALNAWVDENGNEPDGTTTIGIIFVKP